MASDISSDQSASEDPGYRTLAALTTVTLAVVLTGVLLFDVAVPDRGIGAFELLAPDLGVVVGVWGLVTQLGDPWFLMLLATLVYLLGVERSLAEAPHDGAFVLAVTFAAFSFTDLLKNVFAAPRPPGAGTATVPAWLPPALEGTFRSVTIGTGYAFPSGHALGTTAVFLALASQLKVGSSSARWAVAGAGILLVAASRLVIGVHFLVDVVVGVVAGVSLFAVAATMGDRRPLRVFVLGTTLGVLAVAVSAVNSPGSIWQAGQWLGASLGGGLAWYLVRPGAALNLRQTVVVGAPIAVLWVAIYLSAPPLLVAVVGTAVLAGLIVSAPTFVDRVTDPA